VSGITTKLAAGGLSRRGIFLPAPGTGSLPPGVAWRAAQQRREEILPLPLAVQRVSARDPANAAIRPFIAASVCWGLALEQAVDRCIRAAL